MGPFGEFETWSVYVGMAIMAFLLSAAGTWVISMVLLAVYRSRVHRAMLLRSGDAHGSRQPYALPAPNLERPIALQPVAPTGESPLLSQARRRARRAQIVFGVAGLLFGFTAAVVFSAVSDVEWLPVRTTVLTLAFAWPVVPTVLAQSTAGPWTRLGTWAGYFALVIILLTVGGVEIGQALLLIFLVILTPALFVLATSARAVRGAAWLVAPALLLLGMAMLQLQFPVFYLWAGVPFDRLAWTFVGLGLGFLVLLVVYSVVLVAAYRAKLLSDQTLLVLQWWFIAAAWLTIDLGSTYGVRALWGLLPMVVMLGFLWLASLAARRRLRHPPVRLLLLRTFGTRGRSTRLLRDLTRQWRWIGSVELITAPDLATEVLEPDEFVDFIRGRLSRRFVNDGSALRRRLGDLDLVPDGDGRYRLNDFLCRDDTWQPTVEALVTDVHAILVDLRGFSAAHAGVVHEVERLVALVPLQRVVGVVDSSTDHSALQWALNRAAAFAPAAAPIRHHGSGTLQTVAIETGRWQDPRPLLRSVAVAATFQTQYWSRRYR